MPELKDLLVTEASRQQPTRVPPLAELVRARRRRVWLGRAVTAVVVLVLLTGAVGFLHLRTGEPGPPGTGPAPGPAAVAVTGRLLMVGGPPGAEPTGVAGTVTFVDAAGTRTATSARADGAFAVTLPPARYTVTGRSPSFGDGEYRCSADGPVTVLAAGLPDLLVLCQRR